jgi:hypothetical protein
LGDDERHLVLACDRFERRHGELGGAHEEETHGGGL